MKVLTFENRESFRLWLNEHAKNHEGVYLRFSKSQDLVTLSAVEALKEALCFGWIDSTIKKIDEKTYIKYFSKRRSDSSWSSRNRKLALELIENGLMTKMGFEAINLAKQKNLWDIDALDQKDFIGLFSEVIKPYNVAYANYLNMSKSIQNTYATHYFMAKKNETKNKRLKQIIDRLSQNLKPME